MENSKMPAFAKSAFYHPDGGVDSPQSGLTKREYFAGLAMQGILSAQAGDKYMVEMQLEYFAKHYPNDKMNTAIAKESITLADELLKQLESK